MAIQHAGIVGLSFLYFAFFTLLPLSAAERYCYYNETYHLSDDSCTRLCHCATGDCGEDDSGRCPCAVGWMGDHCQYANIASTRIKTSTGYNITLKINYPVSAMQLRLKEKGTYHLMIHIGVGGNLASFDTCFDGLVTYNDTNVDIFCDYPVPGNMIMLQTNMTINRSVGVYGGRNVALWQKTAQSSNYLLWVAGNAVDGRIVPRNFFTGGTCTHTRITPSAWWSVKLDGVYGISWVYIANRNEFQYRLGGFHLIFDPDLDIYQDTTDFSDDIRRNPGDFITIDLINSNHLPAKTKENNYVNITIDRSRIPNRDFNVPLTLCEVQLYACRPTKSGTENCLGFCSDNCIDNSFCNKYDCTLCKKGWIEPKCNKQTATERYCTESTRKSACDVGHCDACDYLCHCRDGAECDLYTGECLTGCAKGWMGKACQYANVAFQQTKAILLSDGDKATCQNVHSKTNTIELERRTVISALFITIYGSETVTITIHIMTGEGPVLCDSNEVIIREGDIFCSHYTRGTAIIIQSNAPVKLCEIQIYGGRNVALWQEATQSSNVPGVDNGLFGANLAVDGNTRNDLVTCQRTGTSDNTDDYPWWKVKLKETYAIHRLKLLFRALDLETQKGFVVSIFDGENDKRVIYTDESDTKPTEVVDIDFVMPYFVQSIEVSTPGRYLHICEFQAYACFPESNGTEECLQFCPTHCESSEDCVNADFSCPKCQAGSTGKYCESEVSCSLPTETMRYHSLTRALYRYNETIELSCKEGHEPVGSVLLQCLENGNWNGTIPSCNAISCSLSLKATEMLVKYRYRETVSVSCKGDYSSQGNVVLQCIAGETWNGTLPDCKGKTVQAGGNHNFIQGRDIALMTVVPILIILLVLTSFQLFRTRRKLVNLSTERSENRAYMDMTFPTTKEEDTYSELQPTI